MKPTEPSAPPTEAIHIADASFSYGKTPAFAHLNLTVHRGDFFALLGRNGAGKSSLVHCLMGFLEPQHGTIEVLGHNAWCHHSLLMNEVALVPESPNVPPTMTAKAAARFCARLGQPGRFLHHQFEATLAAGGVPLNKTFRTLSRGQKTQVTLALALAAQPRVLVLDDPTLGLDAVARREVYRRIIEHQTEHEVSVFMTTHDLASVDGLATHVGFLQEGTLVECGSVAQLKSQYRIAHLSKEEDLRGLPGTVVRQHNTGLGIQVLLALNETDSGGTAENLGAAGGPELDLPEAWAVPTIEELFLALLDQSDAAETSPDSVDFPSSLSAA